MEIQSFNKKYINSLQYISKGLYADLLPFISELSVNGSLEFNANELSKLEDEVRKILLKNGYKKATEIYLKGFDFVTSENIKWYEQQKLSIENYIIKNNSYNELIKINQDNLLGRGFENRIIKGISELIKLDAIKGISFKEASENLKQITLEKPILENHFNTIARDSLNQFNGIINKDVKEKYNLKYMTFIGSLVNDSRPFCIKCKSKKYWSESELITLLNEYCPNGNPSTAKIDIKKEVNGETKIVSINKGAGMIENTNINNFSIFRGGYNCGHEARWTNNIK